MNLRRLAGCVMSQTRPPKAWVIVDNGSVDGTVAIGQALEEEHEWVRLMKVSPAPRMERGGPPVQAFITGVGSLDAPPDVVVKLDADVSFEPDFFDRLLTCFEQNSRLGIASGLCLEQGPEGWREIHSTGSHARGATRAYRWGCFEAVSPLETTMGWDTIDELRARASGWETATIPDIRFYHHRKMATRDGARRSWFRYGSMAHYMEYRPSYFLLRAFYRIAQEPSAVALLGGYLLAAVQRRPRYPDDAVRRLLREEQRLRHLPARALEARGRVRHDRVIDQYGP
jgi:GT2 family glycosyltransferase